MREEAKKLCRCWVVMVLTVTLCLTSMILWPWFGATAQAATSLLFKVTVTGGKGAEVTDPDDSVDPKLYDVTFNCRTGKYVKLYYVTDPAPDFQKFDHWHATVKVRIKHSKFSPVEYSYEEDLTDFCFRPDPTKFTREEQQNISLALSSSEYTVSSFVSVQAVYVDNYWLVSFDPNGAEGTMEAEKANKGQSYVLPECTFTKEGYDFAGWRLGETVYQSGESIEITEDVTLEAQWTHKFYAIDLSSSSEQWGEVSGAGTYMHGSVVTVTATGKTYDGTDYGFLYWGDLDVNEIVSRDASYTFTVTGPRRLKAEFSPYVYVFFQPGGADGDIEQVRILAKTEYVLPECLFTRPGWRFAGWRFPYNNVVQAGETVTVEGQTYVTATWEEIPELTIPIDEEHFPDPGFRDYVRSTEINKNGDEFLTSGELAVSSMTIQSDSVLDITGINYFYELNTLKLSNLTALKELECKRCKKLTSLTIEGCPVLEKADVSWNSALETLTVDQLPALKELHCNNGKLKELKVDKLLALVKLHCESNELTALDVSKNANLSCLVCRENQIESLDVSANEGLVILWCNDNCLTEIDVSENLLLESLSCEKNRLTNLDVSNNKKLETLTCGDNPITVLSVTGLSELYYFDCLNSDALVSLTLDNVPRLSSAYIGKSESITLGKSALVSLNCKAKHLDVSRANSLKTLECYSAGLESVVFGELNYILKNVNLSGNNLKEIDLYELTDLEQLNLSGNQLRELDVFMNTKLKQLYCNDNQLRYLQVFHNPHLSYLDCTQNLIRSLDVSSNSLIKDARGTKLFCDDDVVLHTTQQQHCYVSVSVTPEGSGKAYGEMQWIIGETASLFAEAKEGYRFCHWMEDGEVVCEEPVYEFIAETRRKLVAVFEKENVILTFKHNVEFDNNIAMHYIIPVSELDGYSNLRLVIDKEVYAEGVATPTIQQYVLENPAPYKVNGVDYWHFTFPGISASEMGNALSAKVVCEKNGVTFESQSDVYAVKDYAYARLAKTSSASYKKVLVDMLNYGAAAQEHFNKNADKPVNADLTDEQKAFGSSLEDFSVKKVENVIPLNGATASFDAKNLVFGSNVELVYRMDFSNFKTDAPEGTTEAEKMANVKVVFTYDNGKGEKTMTVPYSKFTTNGGKYVASCSVLTPAEMGCTVNATICDGDVPVSETLQYSIESYVDNRLSGTGSNSETFKELLKRMVLYGQAVKEHFSN